MVQVAAQSGVVVFRGVTLLSPNTAAGDEVEVGPAVATLPEERT